MVQGTLPGAYEGKVLVGKYRLAELLGRGGMGEVYRAENLMLGRPVAIKLLLPELVRDPDIVQRFLREARAANMVRHPNVVDVQDVGEAPDAGPFLVQELLEGEDLGAYLTRVGRLSGDEMREFFGPILDAMAHAHARGVVHRDLKPENVFLARSHGRTVPKLLDFGISKVGSLAGEKRLTATHNVMGSPAYMAPEQVAGGTVDARADVWALGVVMYEALSGSLPFDAPSTGALLIRIATTDPAPLANLDSSIPQELIGTVSRCLLRDAAQRYANAAELRDDLNRIWRPASPTTSSDVTAGAQANAPAETAPKLPDIPSLGPVLRARRREARPECEPCPPPSPSPFHPPSPSPFHPPSPSPSPVSSTTETTPEALDLPDLFEAGASPVLELDIRPAVSPLRAPPSRQDCADRARNSDSIRKRDGLTEAYWLVAAAFAFVAPFVVGPPSHPSIAALSIALSENGVLSGRSGYGSTVAAVVVAVGGFIGTLHALHRPRSLGLLLAGVAFLGWAVAIGYRCFGSTLELGPYDAGADRAIATAPAWCAAASLAGGALVVFGKAWRALKGDSVRMRVGALGLVVVASLACSLACALASDAAR